MRLVTHSHSGLLQIPGQMMRARRSMVETVTVAARTLGAYAAPCAVGSDAGDDRSDDVQRRHHLVRHQLVYPRYHSSKATRAADVDCVGVTLRERWETPQLVHLKVAPDLRSRRRRSTPT